MPRYQSEISPLEDYIEKVTRNIIDERETKLKEEDAKSIIDAMIPEIEKIVAKVVIKHLKAISVFVQNNLKE